jgi:DNA-binding MarR family transcriptional regulator
MSTDIASPFATTLFIRDHCLCLHAQRAARTLARRFDAAFRRLGLTNGQFSLLNALNRPAPPSMGEVAALLGMDRTTLTAALKPLEQQGRVVVEPDSRDRRQRRLRLTAAGAAVLAEATPIWIAEHAALERELPPPVSGDHLRAGLGALAGFAKPAAAAAGSSSQA